MKQSLVLAALALSLLSGSATAIAGGKPKAKPAAATSAASIVGKWQVTSVHYPAEKGQKMPSQAEMDKTIKEKNMAYEFGADGSLTITADDTSFPTGRASYKKTGSKLEITDKDPKNPKQTAQITSLTDKKMVLKLGGVNMTMFLEKV